MDSFTKIYGNWHAIYMRFTAQNLGYLKTQGENDLYVNYTFEYKLTSKVIGFKPKFII